MYKGQIERRGELLYSSSILGFRAVQIPDFVRIPISLACCPFNWSPKVQKGTYYVLHYMYTTKVNPKGLLIGQKRCTKSKEVKTKIVQTVKPE